MIKDFEELHREEEAVDQQTNRLSRVYNKMTNDEKNALVWIAEGVILARPIYDGTLPTQ